jgi:hypothetical protein
MKTRSALLLLFMIAVPAAAMFSHRIPADVRRSLRQQFGRLTAAMTPTQPVVSGSAGTAPAPPATAAEPPSAPRVASPATAAPLAPRQASLPASPRGGGDDIAGELARLGAIGFECRPIAGGRGDHVATCSVPLDGSGQLLRVFHVTGGDARSATASLLDDVAAWRDRAGLPRAAGAPAALGERPLRF